MRLGIYIGQTIRYTNCFFISLCVRASTQFVAQAELELSLMIIDLTISLYAFDKDLHL